MRCPITYEPIPEGRYSRRGLRLLSPRLRDLRAFPFTAEEQRAEAARRAGRMSIQGVQPKLSAILDVPRQTFVPVDTKGRYILKLPQETYPELPANEDVTMRLAAAAGISTPLHGLLYARDESLTYFIRRFDRVGRTGKLPVEDFAQLAGRSRDTKYDSSMEQVAQLIGEYTSFPAVERVSLFRLTLFNFLTGNEDMHLKNFSVMTEADRVRLSPAYDLVNTTLAMGGAPEEIALPLRGKKRNLTHTDLVQYFGAGRLELPPVVISRVLADLAAAQHQWSALLAASFLSPPLQAGYERILQERARRLFV